MSADGDRRRMEAELDCTAEAARAAREFVAAALAAWDLDDEQRLATLLTSEVVTNAVLHAQSNCRLAIEHIPPEVMVEVWDRSPSLPAVQLPDLDQEKGRGLYLVKSLASRWGMRPDGEGKAIWFAVNLAPPRGTSPAF
jgi:anti-sigma regulatory factor (Ser/Thr protein kinase)